MAIPLPPHEIRVFMRDDPPPAEAEELFAAQLADSQRPEPLGESRCGAWNFYLICAVAVGDHVLGGVCLDFGPISGDGPLACERLAYLERTLVRPEYRRRGLATAVLRHAIVLAHDAGCEYIRCHADWDNAAETALFRRCGFALVDLNGEQVEDPSYLAIRSLQNLHT